MYNEVMKGLKRNYEWNHLLQTRIFNLRKASIMRDLNINIEPT